MNTLRTAVYVRTASAAATLTPIVMIVDAGRKF
ncbi:MAG: hypothetical protein JWN08_2448 [Frankiales bacterium]|nr:hypothetical protein [Frankiales bacterium]